MNERYYYVYIMTNPRNTVLYTGMTNDVARRVEQHREKLVDGFTKKYNCIKLVFIEVFTSAYDAIVRRISTQEDSLDRTRKSSLARSYRSYWPLDCFGRDCSSLAKTSENIKPPVGGFMFSNQGNRQDS